MAAEAEMEEKNSETIGQNQTNGDADAIEQSSVLNEKIKDDAPSPVIEGKLSASEGEVFIGAPSEDKLTSEQMFVDEGSTAKEKVSECREHLKIDENDEFEEAKDEALRSQLLPNVNLINDVPTEQTTDESSKMDGQDETDVLESKEERDLGKRSEEYESPEKLPILEVKEKYPQNDGESTENNAEEQQSSEELGSIVHGKDEEEITESSHETPIEQQTNDSKIDTFSDAQLTNETLSVYEEKEPEETEEIAEALLDKGHHYENSDDQGGVEPEITTSNEEEIHHNEDREQQSEVKNNTDCMNPEKASVDEHSKAIEAINSTNVKSDDSEKEKEQADILVKSEEYSDAVATEATVGLEMVQDKPEESTVEDTSLSETKEVDEAGETEKLNKGTINTEGPAVRLEEASHDASLDVPNEQEHGYQGEEETNAKTPDNTNTKEIIIAIEQEDEAMTKVSSNNEETEGEKISSVKGDSEPKKVEDEYISNTVGDAPDTGEPNGKAAGIDDVVDDVQEETLGCTCDKQHQENVESHETNEDGEQGEEEHQTLQQEALVSEVENQETTSSTGANKMEISKEGENLMNMISESVNPEETKIENEMDDEKIKENVEDNPQDHALPSQTIHDAADEDQAGADQSLVGKDGDIASLEKENIKSKGPDEVQPSELEAHQSLVDKDHDIISLEEESIESKGPDEVQLSESEATEVGNIASEDKPKVAEIASTTDDAEITSVEGGESVDVDKDKAEYQQHENVRESVIEEENQGEATETQMAKSQEIPAMDDQSPEKASETNELMMKDIHDKTERKHEEEPDFANNEPINQTTVPEQSRIPEEENTIIENKTESIFPTDATENPLKSDPEEKDEEMLKNEESSHIFPEPSPDADHNIVEGLSHHDEGNKTCEHAARETASCDQTCEANEEQIEKPEKPNELKQDIPMKYSDTVNSQEETLNNENPDNVEDGEKYEGKDETTLTLERASAADFEEPSHRPFSNCEEISGATNLGYDFEPDSASNELLHDNIESNESKENDEQREEKFQNPHDIESELEVKKEETTSEAESTKVSEPVNVDEDATIADTMDDESVKENVEDNPESNAVPPQTKHDAVGEKHQETEDSSSPPRDEESTETQGLDSTEEPVAEVQTAEAEDINAGYREDKEKPEVPESAGVNDDSKTASMKEREDTKIDDSNINDALIEESNEIPDSFYEEKAHQLASTEEGNEVDVNEDKTECQEYNNISEPTAEQQNQEKENETELTKNSEVSEMGDITEDPESVKTKDENRMQENICGFLETQVLVTEEIREKVDIKHEEVPNSPCGDQSDQTSTTEGNVDFGRNKEKLPETLEAQKEPIIVPQEKNQIVVPDEKSGDTISKTETNKIENVEEENTNGDETSGLSFENSMSEFNSELACKAEKEEEIPKDEEISHILPEPAEVIPEKQTLGDDGNYEDPGCTIVEKVSHQDETSICEDVAPETVLDNQNKKAKENLEDATREEDVESAAESIKEKELEITEDIEEKEVGTEIQTSETNEIKDAAYEISKCEEICTHDESTNISHQDEESENMNNKDEGSTFQKIDNTPVTTSLADEAALEYLHEDQKELATMADTEMQSRGQRNQEDDAELTTPKEQILEATTEVEPAKDEMSKDQNYKLDSEDSEGVNPKEEETVSRIHPTLPEETEEGIETKQEANPREEETTSKIHPTLPEETEGGVEIKQEANPNEEETTSKIHPTLPEETEEGTETKQQANPNHDEETHEHVIKNNVIDLDTLINGSKSEEPAEASEEISKEPSRVITTETGVVTEKGLMEGEVTTSEETNKLVFEDLDPRNDEKIEPPFIRALDEPVVPVTTSEETDKLVSKNLDLQNEKEVGSPQARENALDEQIVTPTNLVTTTQPVSTAKEDDAAAKESLKSIDQEVKDFNLVSDEHVHEQSETNPDDIQPLQDETTAEDSSSTKELNHELEMSAPAIASEDEIHDIKQASETTNETILEKENKEYQEVEGNSEAKEKDGQDQQEIKRKQLIENECEPINTNECSKEIEDSGAIRGVTQDIEDSGAIRGVSQDNRNKEQEVHKIVETKETEYEKQEEQTAMEVFEGNQAIYKDETSKEESDPIGDRIGTSALEYEDKSSYHHNKTMHIDDTIAGVVAKEDVESAAENIKERELEIMENIEEIQTSETNEIKDAEYEVPQCEEICTYNESTKIAHQDEESENVNNKDEVKDFNLESDEHIQEKAETNQDGIQPLQDETTTEDPSSIKELKHELEMSTPAMASEDQIHQTKQASGTTNETVLEKENKEYVEIDVNSEAKEMDRQDQLEIERKQLTGNECEPINTDECSKEIEDSGATLDVAQDNRNKEPEGPKSADTEEMEYEKEEEQTATEVFKANEAIYKDETSKEESNPIGDRIGTSAREYEDKSSYHHNEPTHVDDTTAGVVTKEEIESAAKNIKERELETMENIIEREVATAEIQTSETNEIKDAEYEVPQCDKICTHNENTNITHQDEESENVNNKDEGSTFQKTDNAHVPTSLTDEAALEYLHEDQKELPTTADIETESRLSRNQEDDSELTTSKEQNLEATTEVDTTRDEMSEDQNYRLANEEFEIANPKEEETASKIQTVLALPKETKEGIETNQEANPDHCEETCEHISKNNVIDLDTPINGNKSEELAEASAEILEEQSRAITIETEAVAEKSSMECEVTTSEETNKLVSEDFDPPKEEKVELPLIRQKDLDEPIVEVTTLEEAHKLVTEDLDAQNDKEVESQQIREKAADEQIETPTNLEPASTTKEDDATQEESLKSIDQEVKDLNLGSDEHIQEKAETNPDDIQPLQDETAAAEDAPSTKELKHELEMSAPTIASEDQIHQIKQASETTNETLLEKESKEYQEVEGDSEAKEMNGQDQEEINRKQLIGKEWELVNTNECNTEIEDGEAALGSIRDNKGKQEEVHKSAETKEMEYEVQAEETATGVIEANQTTYKDESSVEGSNVIGDRIGTSAPEYENQSSYHNDEPQQVDNTITGVVTQKEIVTAENEIFEEHENPSKNNEPDEELKPKETDATLNENPTDMVNEADAALAEKDTITDEKTEEEIKTREMDNDFASKEIVGLETVSEHVSTNWDTVSEALKANIMTLDDNEKDKDVTDKIVHNLGIEKEDTPLVVLSEKEIPEKLSTNEAIEDTQNEKESFPPADTAENEDKQQTEQDVLPVSRYLMDRILQDKSGNNDETLEVESEEMRRGKTTAQTADDTIVSKREVQDVKSAKDDNSSVEEHAHDPEKSIEKSLETNDGIQDNNLGNAPPVVAAGEDVKEEFSTGIMSREKDPEKEVDADELKSKDLSQDDKIPITGPQLIETATPKASEEDAPNEGERCEVEMLRDIPKDDEVANETPEQQTSSLSDDAIQSVEIPQKSRCLEADYSTESSNDRENMLEEALVALPKSVEVGNEEVEKGQIPENSVLEVLEVVPAGLKDENGEENQQQTTAESQTTMANVDLPEETEVPDSQNVQKPDTKIESGTGTVELDEKCLEKIDAAAICTQEKQSEKVENAITEEGESDADKKDETKGGDEHKSDDFGHSSYVIVENEEGKQDKTPEVDTLEEDLETRPKDENAGNEEEKQETATESETMMTKVDLPDEPEVPPDSQKAQKLDTEVESAKRAVEPDEKCSEVVNLAISAKEKRSEKVTGATSEEEKTDNDDDDDEKDRRGRGEVEHRAEDAGNNAAVIVEAREVELKPTHKKSHNILSGVGSKVKHSFAKVKKAITGKSSHPKTVSPR